MWLFVLPLVVKMKGLYCVETVVLVVVVLVNGMELGGGWKIFRYGFFNFYLRFDRVVDSFIFHEVLDFNI